MTTADNTAWSSAKSWPTALQVQAENPTQHVASPVQMTDGRYLLCADLLSAVPNGLYGPNFTRLDASRFDEIALLPWADAWRCSRSLKNFRRLIVSGQWNIGTVVQI
jgi:hypothetical protein